MQSSTIKTTHEVIRLFFSSFVLLFGWAVVCSFGRWFVSFLFIIFFSVGVNFLISRASSELVIFFALSVTLHRSIVLYFTDPSNISLFTWFSGCALSSNFNVWVANEDVCVSISKKFHVLKYNNWAIPPLVYKSVH